MSTWFLDTELSTCFHLLEKILRDNNLLYSPVQIYNVDAIYIYILVVCFTLCSIIYTHTCISAHSKDKVNPLKLLSCSSTSSLHVLRTSAYNDKYTPQCINY